MAAVSGQTWPSVSSTHRHHDFVGWQCSPCYVELGAKLRACWTEVVPVAKWVQVAAMLFGRRWADMRNAETTSPVRALLCSKMLPPAGVGTAPKLSRLGTFGAGGFNVA